MASIVLGDRFWSKVDRSQPGGCWSWIGYRNFGYGQFYLNGKNRAAHRVAYEALVGPIPDGLVLDHLCHSNAESCVPTEACPHRRCVNPAHLEPVTNAENVRRGIPTPGGGGAGAAKKTHCKEGHPYDAVNTYPIPKGGRDCRACRRQSTIRRTERRRARVAAARVAAAA